MEIRVGIRVGIKVRILDTKLDLKLDTTAKENQGFMPSSKSWIETGSNRELELKVCLNNVELDLL